MLGRAPDHPAVAALKERHYHFVPAYNETRSGVCLTVNGHEYTPEELVAMVLHHAKDITAAYGVTSPLKDCVLTVPAYFTQHERRALLDAAELADFNVLALINENTAAALHHGIDRIDEQPLNYLFYNMGAASTQVSVVRYLSYPHKTTKYGKEKTVGGFEVLSSAWDATLGGTSFDARLVDYMAEEFNAVWNKERGTTDKDVKTVPRAMAKLMIQANKVKHVLSANTDIPVYIDALTDDVNYQSHISRATLEEVCHDLLDRAAAPITRALELANITLAELDAVEMIGGAMRVPKVQEAVRHILEREGDPIDLGMHLNSDESMALGAAFHGANVSTSFKVRHVGLQDVNSFPIDVDLTDLAGKGEKKGGAVSGGLFGVGRRKAEAQDDDEEQWAKHATIFKLGSKLGVKKTIAFSHDEDVHVEVGYVDGATLPAGTGLSIEQYDVSGIAEFADEMKEKGLDTAPKVSLQFELDGSGLVGMIKAEAVVEETVMVMEEVEVDDEEEGSGDNSTESAGEKSTESEEGKEKTESDATKTDESEEKKVDSPERKDGEDTAETDGSEAEKDDSSKAEKDESAEAQKDDSADDKEGEDAASADKDGEDKKEDGEEEKKGEDQKDDGEEEKKEGEEKKDDGDKEKKEAPKKKKKTITVEKEKKKKHTRALKVRSYNVGSIRPYSSEIMEESMDKLERLAQADRERVMLEESKNKFESYIYRIRNRLIDDEEEIAKVTSEEQREALRKSGEEAEDWMFDEGYTADLKTYEAKYLELSAPAEKTFFRVAELTARPKAVEALQTKLGKVEGLMKKWETTMEHVTEEERQEVQDRVDDARAWAAEAVEKQEEADPTGDPAFTSDEVPGQTKKIESIVSRLMRKPKPKPEKKNETETDGKANEAETDANDTEADSKNETSSDGAETDETAEQTEAEEKKEDEASEDTAAADEETSDEKKADGDAAVDDAEANDGGVDDGEAEESDAEL